MSNSIEKINERVERLEQAMTEVANIGTKALDKIAADVRTRAEEAMTSEMSAPTANQIASKLNGLDRGVVPVGCTHLTMFVDVHGDELCWLIAAWKEDFSGYIVDYGFEDIHPGSYLDGVELENAIRDSLESLIKSKLWQQWKCKDGTSMTIGCCMIDANWGRVTDLVREFCTKSGLRQMTRLLSSRARYVSATDTPFSDYRRQPEDHVGPHWHIVPVKGVLFDVNYWKSAVRERLVMPMGKRCCLSLFGRDPKQHRLLAEHLTAEYRMKTEGRGRTVDEWRMRIEGGHHDWLDCLVGCAVGASIEDNLRPEMDRPHWINPRSVILDGVTYVRADDAAGLPTIKQAAANVRQACKAGEPDEEQYTLRCGCCKNEVRVNKHLLQCAGCDTQLCPDCRLVVQDGLNGWNEADNAWWIHHTVVCPVCWPKYQTPEMRYRTLSEGPPMTQEVIDAFEKERNEG